MKKEVALMLFGASFACAEDTFLSQKVTVQRCWDKSEVEDVKDCPPVPTQTFWRCGRSEQTFTSSTACPAEDPPRATCADGSRADEHNVCPPVIQTVTTTVTQVVEQLICVDGTRVSSATECPIPAAECPANSRLEDGACTCPEDATLIFGNGVTVTCPKTEPFFVCEQTHDVVNDTSLCPRPSTDCPPGSWEEDGACTCPTDAALIFPTGTVVLCPSREVEERHFYVCRDTSVVNDPTLCPAASVTCPAGSELAGSACTCPDGTTLRLENGLAVTCPRPQAVTQFYWFCEDRTVVTDPLLCPVPPDSCPNGSVRVNSSCTCPNGTTLLLDNGLTVECPEPGITVVTSFVCADFTPVANPTDCPVPAATCPTGSLLVGGACTCPSGMTLTLENGLTIPCPEIPVMPEPCEGLRITDVTPDTITVGTRMILPNGRSPTSMSEYMPLYRFTMEACDGSELVLGAHVLTMAFSGNAPLPVDVRVNSVTTNYAITINALPASRILDPDFTRNYHTSDGGLDVYDEIIRGRQLEVTVGWRAPLPTEVITATLQQVEAQRTSDGTTVSWTPVPLMAKQIVVDNNPCHWTTPPDMYIGDPNYGWNPVDQNVTGAGSTLTLLPLDLYTCTDLRLDGLYFDHWDTYEVYQNPQIQADNTGTQFGAAALNVFDQFNLSLDDGFTVVAFSGTVSQNHWQVDQLEGLNVSIPGRIILAGSHLRILSSLHVNSLLPTEAGVHTRFAIEPYPPYGRHMDGTPLRRWVFPSRRHHNLFH
ncbi:hypothetical protein HYV73_04835 [Candidatus Uhrbacteria bacterium]|nr:hypothetical protein [Candidatus Uhrbacteria bacterium]